MCFLLFEIDNNLLQILVGADGHKADDDVGHPEVAQAPTQAGNDVLPTAEEAPVVEEEAEPAEEEAPAEEA